VIVVHVKRSILPLQANGACPVLGQKHSVVLPLINAILANEVPLTLALRIAPVPLPRLVRVGVSPQLRGIRLAALAVREDATATTILPKLSLWLRDLALCACLHGRHSITAPMNCAARGATIALP
jgi:hypothetical protein